MIINKYLKEFYSLHCYPEILESILPIQNLKKEITESMAIVKKIKRIVLSNKNINFKIYDFCAGNALTSVICSFLFKNVNCVAIDKIPRDRNWNDIKNFKYFISDVNHPDWPKGINDGKKLFPETKIIIIGVHACRNLSESIINIYNNSEADYLILMPCCMGTTGKYNLPKIIVEKIGKYLKWCLYLQTKISGESKLSIDDYCMSPKNAIITVGL